MCTLTRPTTTNTAKTIATTSTRKAARSIHVERLLYGISWRLPPNSYSLGSLASRFCLNDAVFSMHIWNCGCWLLNIMFHRTHTGSHACMHTVSTSTPQNSCMHAEHVLLCAFMNFPRALTAPLHEDR